MPQVVNNLLSTPDPLDTPVNRGDVVLVVSGANGTPVPLLVVERQGGNMLSLVEPACLWEVGEVLFEPGTLARDIPFVILHPIEVIPAEKVQITLSRVE